MVRSEPGCPAYFPPASAIPEYLSRSQSAAFWAAALRRIVAQSLAIHGGLQWVGFYLSGAALVSLIALLTLGHEGNRKSNCKRKTLREVTVSIVHDSSPP